MTYIVLAIVLSLVALIACMGAWVVNIIGNGMVDAEDYLEIDQ